MPAKPSSPRDPIYRGRQSKKRIKCIRNAFEIYCTMKQGDAIPARLRTFLSNYTNVVKGKRCGNIYPAVNEILQRCVLHFHDVVNNAYTCRKASAASGPRVSNDDMRGRVEAWCECFRTYGQWPSLPCYIRNKASWQDNALLSRLSPTKLVNSFKNYRQSACGNGSGTIHNAEFNACLLQLDPTVFNKKYKTRATPRTSVAREVVPPFIYKLPFLHRDKG